MPPISPALLLAPAAAEDDDTTGAELDKGAFFGALAAWANAKSEADAPMKRVIATISSREGGEEGCPP